MGALTRRTFLERTGFLAAAGLLAQLPDVPGWLDRVQAAAAKPDLVRDTMNGLVAFVVPGPDRYSRAQGESSKRPGGIAAGTTKALIDTLDLYVRASPPLSVFVASILNSGAVTLDPGVVNGRFDSAFANLAFSQKAEVFRRLEALDSPAASPLRFLGGNLPGLVAFLAYSEAGVFKNTRPRKLKRRPVGWALSRYSGVADGRRELKGYFQGRRRAGGA
jgi:hypothetical protein